MKNYFYVTTPIYYVNDKPHIGHAYSTIIADCMARFKRLCGYKVFFLTGTDEHGLKIEKEANLRGVSPQTLADSVHIKFKELFKNIDISYDRFIRTTDEDHVKTVKTVFEKLLKKGDIYLSEFEGWYCTPCETFLTEKALVEVKYEVVNADRDTNTEIKKIVISGNCPQCGRPAAKIKEESYFLKLEKYEKKLLDYIENNPDFIKPNFRKNEVISFIKEGLKDLSISRTSFKWGIPVPGNDRHVIYVWFDALLNYLTGIGYIDFVNGKNPDFEPLFGSANHIVGKDILRFHAVYWPIMLFALELELPKTIMAHGWWLMDNKKMSKSLGNVIDPLDLIKKFGADALRFYLLSEITLGLDGDFNMDNFITRYNSGLANDLGNLISRTVAMLKKYAGGFVPEGSVSEDEAVLELAVNILGRLEEKYGNYDFANILEDIFKFINIMNKYINDSAPWKLNLENAGEKLKLLQILKTASLSIYYISYMIYPFMPETSKKINCILNISAFDEQDIYLRPEDLPTYCKNSFKDGRKIAEKAEILFPKVK